MKLYNTLTRQIDTVEPLQPPRTTVYTCGPTVYDYAHIGHWFNYIRMDIMIRTLILAGYEPQWVMNITDVGHLVSDADEGEDKLEKGARREGKTAWEVAEFYTTDFLECMNLLHITTPDNITKATDHIPEQIELISKLEAKGFTYIISDGVYYDTSKFEGYAAFARLDLEGQQAGARVEYNSEKRNPPDFALWKFSPPASEGNGDKRRDMEWESPWGIGFPGWHIECSAMAMKYLGETLDIHAGGIDHIPVHHTNEIAQSEAVTGKRFANYWMHSNHVMVEGEKISKSLGNGIRLQEIIAKGITAEAVRLHVLESHYRSQSQFSMDGLEAAQNRLRNLQAFADLVFQSHPDAEQLSESSTMEGGYFQKRQDEIRTALANDLSTPEALRILAQVVDDTAAGKLHPQDASELADKFLPFLDHTLGLQLAGRSDITADEKQLISDRETARAEKDWPASDALRDQLAAKSLGLRDTERGAIWYRL